MMPEDKLMVTQADRDAAADLADVRSLITPESSKDIRAGLWDDWNLVQAFARHRLAAISATGVEGLLEALQASQSRLRSTFIGRGLLGGSCLCGAKWPGDAEAHREGCLIAANAAAIAKAGGQEA